MQIASLPRMSQTTLSELQDGLESGAFTSEHLVRTYLKRIEEVNDTVHAVIEVNSSAVETARALDEERQLNRRRG
jgi:amidase